jgi:hypothetical protein
MQYGPVGNSQRQTVIIIVIFLLLKLLIHLPFNGRYGYHADELLYMAMADQLAWGYKEGPPFISFVTWVSVQLAGDSLWMLRLLPTLCGAALVGVTGLMVRMLGGGNFAVLVACTAILLDPSFLATGYMMQPVVFDQLGWALCCFFLLRFVKKGNKNDLLYLGVIAGLGMMNKFSIALYLFTLLTAIFMGAGRRLTIRDIFYITIPGLVIVLPHFIWQLNNGFPFVAQLLELKTHYWSKTEYATLAQQILFSHGASGLVSLAGVAFFLFSARLRAYRFIGLSFLLLQLVFLYLQAKPYYSFGAFPVLYAGGAVCMAELLKTWKRPLVTGAFFVTVIVPGVIAIPVVVPVLPLHYTVGWLDVMRRHTGITGPLQWDDGTTGRIPQYFAQMLGWEKLAKETIIVYRSLPESKRASTVILTDNYQQAGAISFYGKDQVPATVSLRPSFFSLKNVRREPEYTIMITSRPRAGSDTPAGLLSSQRIDYPNAEVNGSVIYLIRRGSDMAYQAP